MRKKLVALLLSLIACLGLAFSFASCEEKTKTQPRSGTVGELAFSLSEDGTYYRVGGNFGGRNETDIFDIVIPDTYENLPVKEIAFGAFGDWSNLRSIKIPESITTIQSRAFYGCERLMNVEIPDSVTTIGPEVFEECENLQYTTYESAKYLGNENNPYVVLMEAMRKKVTDFHIHENTKIIYHLALTESQFVEQMELGIERINIPKGVAMIGICAFDYCRNLTTVYYGGTETEWNAIIVGNDNEALTSATRYYYSETQPTGEGNYWHYVDGVPTVW